MTRMFTTLRITSVTMRNPPSPNKQTNRAGLVVAPTAIINSTPLDCNLCQSDSHCPDDRFRVQEPKHLAVSTNVTPKDFNAWWVKKYCTKTAVDGFLMYFPYILLIMAMVIVLIERVFVRWVWIWNGVGKN